MNHQQLTDLIGELADRPTNRFIARLVQEGAEWIADPQVDGVYGLRPALPLPGDEGYPNRVVVIVYLTSPSQGRPFDDFEVSESFERASRLQKGARK